MSLGILNNSVCRTLYEEMNTRKVCIDCRVERRKFELTDKKHNNCFSNMIPGFSSSSLHLPIDIMIVAEAHGGGRKEGFRQQTNLQAELEGLESYYLQQTLSKYHQSEMRVFLKNLNELNVSWVFTDLVKCFVWQGKKDDLDGRENFRIAIKHCSKYLEQQLRCLKPKVIVSLGGRVSSFFEIKYPKHGTVYQRKGFNIIHSTFPSRNTADHWVKNKEWTIIVRELKRLIEH